MIRTPIITKWANQIRYAFENERGVLLGRMLDPSLLLLGSANQGFTFLGCSQSAQAIMDTPNIVQGIKGLIPQRMDLEDLLELMSIVMSIVKETLVRFPQPIKWGSIVQLGISSLTKVFDLLENEEKSNPLKSHSWLIPLLVKTVKCLTNSASQADSIATSSSNASAELDATADQDQMSGHHQQEVLNAMRMHIGKCQRNNERLSSRSIFVVLMAESIRACIALRNIKMAGQFSKTIEQAGFHKLDLSHVPNGPTVTYRATIGLLSMQEENFSKANDEFTWAIQHMQKKKQVERRDLMDKLITVRLRLGVLPPTMILKKYDLAAQYGSLCQAIREGNVKLFERSLNSNAAWFMHQGTLLIVERAKFLCFRTLIQRTVTFYRESLVKSHPGVVAEEIPGYYHIPLDLLTLVFKPQIESDDPDLFTEFDQEELGCIVVAVIAKNLLKGYVAWKSKILVLSKQNPFPSVKSTEVRV